MIKIGISACFEYESAERPVFSPKVLTYVERDMSRYITRRGILPVLIPDVEDRLLVEIVQEMDGIVMQGGTDLAPQTYGEEPIGRWKGDAYRDAYELKVLGHAMKMEKPILGICRGFQLMNVYFGGTLYQDTVTQNAKADDHRSAEKYDTIKHPIQFPEGSYLGELYANEQNPHVNTVHHQAVKKLGINLEVYATSPDGLIEAFGYTKALNGKVMGVQWHPEFFHTIKNELIDADKLFEAFLAHCK